MKGGRIRDLSKQPRPSGHIASPIKKLVFFRRDGMALGTRLLKKNF